MHETNMHLLKCGSGAHFRRTYSHLANANMEKHLNFRCKIKSYENLNRKFIKYLLGEEKWHSKITRTAKTLPFSLLCVEAREIRVAVYASVCACIRIWLSASLLMAKKLLQNITYIAHSAFSANKQPCVYIIILLQCIYSKFAFIFWSHQNYKYHIRSYSTSTHSYVYLNCISLKPDRNNLS